MIDILLRLCLPIVAFYSIQSYAAFAIGNTIFWWAINSIVLASFFLVSGHVKNYSVPRSAKVLRLYLWWNVIAILWGCSVAENYWDWKGLADNAMALLLPISAYLAFNKDRLHRMLRGYVRFAIPSFMFILVYANRGAYGFYLALVPLLLLALPLIQRRWQVVLLILATLVLFADFGARSSVIKFSIPLLLLPLYVFARLRSKWILEWIRLAIFFLPVFLFYLGVSGIFNVFNIDEYIGGQYVDASVVDGQRVDENLKADTRTRLYHEVLTSADKHDSWWFGRSPARGNDTVVFEDLREISGRAERLRNEAAILNVFNWTGIIGVALYGLIFFVASRLAVVASSNMFCRLVGIFVAFNWAYSWVENGNIFNLNYIGIWLMVGICLSPEMRRMSDSDMRYWIRGLFVSGTKRGRNAYRRYVDAA